LKGAAVGMLMAFHTARARQMKEAPGLVKSKLPNLVLMDIAMGGLEAVARNTKSSSAAKM
jgi:CheY-like chemotaxis protein